MPTNKNMSNIIMIDINKTINPFTESVPDTKILVKGNEKEEKQCENGVIKDLLLTILDK